MAKNMRAYGYIREQKTTHISYSRQYQQKVSGYTRKDGTEVSGYTRKILKHIEYDRHKPKRYVEQNFSSENGRLDVQFKKWLIEKGIIKDGEYEWTEGGKNVKS